MDELKNHRTFIDKTSSLSLPNKRLVFIFSLIFAFITSILLFSNEPFNAPPTDWDGVYYDALAAGLSRGEGYKPFLDEIFEANYRESNVIVSNYRSWLNQSGLDGFTTFNPPFHPSFIALTYRIWGHRYAAYKFCSILFFSLGMYFILLRTPIKKSPLAALMLALYILTDTEYIVFIRGLLSEPLVFLLVSFALYKVLGPYHKNSPLDSIVLGLVSGLLILTKTFFIFWIPAFIFILKIQNRLHVKRDICVFFGTLLIIIGPWFIRNCMTLHAFMPLGSQGGYALYEMYHDTSPNGRWIPSTLNSLTTIKTSLTGTARELFIAQTGINEAKQFIRDKPVAFLYSALHGVQSFWWPPERPDQKMLIVCGLIGLFAIWKDPIRNPILTFLICHTLAILCTYNDYNGRFFFVLQPIFLVLMFYGFAFLFESSKKLIIRYS